jgi:hypothetical protein
MRHHFAFCMSVLLLSALLAIQLPLPLYADDPPKELTPVAERAIDRGLEWLAKQQNEDGSWTAWVGRKEGMGFAKEQSGAHVGVSALACLAFLSGGNLPGKGRYGREMEKGLDFILSCVNENGFISKYNTRMYEHGYAALFLAEVAAMTDRADQKDRVKRELRKAIRLIAECQNEHGGWRYLPFDNKDDMSVTVCQVQAIRAARDIGIAVPHQTVDHAIEYLKSMRIDRPGQRGAYHYTKTLGGGDRVSFPLTGAGAVSLYGLGIYQEEEHIDSLHQLWAMKAGPDAPVPIPGDLLRRGDVFETRPKTAPQRFDYFYGHYYAIQAMYQAGGDHWKYWWPMMRDELVELQNEEGAWLDDIHPSYATAMACFILQVPYRYLPILQR